MKEFMKLKDGFIVKRIVPVVAGALLGYAYYHFIGCSGGTCPITGNPYISTAYGGLTGLIIALPRKKKA
ncbi:MAG: DUF6132 family protein [Ignavibacteria bacterium]